MIYKKSHYFYIVFYLAKSNDFVLKLNRHILPKRGGFVAKKRSASTVTPDYEAITSFQKGQASRIFKEVNEQDKVLIVSKQNKPQNVVISYERYKRLREEGADI